VRQVGRGVSDRQPSVKELCGRCVGTLAIFSDGMAHPCVFSRWLPVGNIHDQTLGEILDGPDLETARRSIGAELGRRPASNCDPSACEPNDSETFCLPKCCGPDCDPQNTR
jgi:hypothetical protein